MTGGTTTRYCNVEVHVEEGLLIIRITPAYPGDPNFEILRDDDMQVGIELSSSSKSMRNSRQHRLVPLPRGQLTSSKGLVSGKQLSHTSLTALSAVSVSGHAGFAATDSTALLLTHA